MDASQEQQQQAYYKLSMNLEELIKLYRNLWDILKKEKDYLVSADIQKLEEINKEKESLLFKIRAVDAIRERLAKDLAAELKIQSQYPRLLEMAAVMNGDRADRLRNYHSTLDLLLQRLNNQNKENEEYTNAALQNLNGALNNIKETLAGKKTYEKKGRMTTGPEKSGNFVSKEA